MAISACNSSGCYFQSFTLYSGFSKACKSQFSHHCDFLTAWSRSLDCEKPIEKSTALGLAWSFVTPSPTPFVIFPRLLHDWCDTGLLSSFCN